MSERIKRIDSYISESEAILKKNNTLEIKEQILKIKCELGFDGNLDNEYSMFSVNHYMYDKDKQIPYIAYKSNEKQLCKIGR